MWWHSARKQGPEHCHKLKFTQHCYSTIQKLYTLKRSWKTLYFSGSRVHRFGIWQTDRHTMYVSLCLCMCICTQNMTSHNTIWNVGCPQSKLVNTLKVSAHSVTTAAVIHDNNISLSSYLMQITNKQCSCFQCLKYGSLYASYTAPAMV